MDNAVLTIDTDWAPDFAIDSIAEPLIARQVRATWFVTHMSPAIERLRQHPELFELGIHPNFLPGSTHGDTPDAVLRHCMELVPEAISVRTHALVQSTPLLDQIITCTPIVSDVSLFLPYLPFPQPVEYQWKGRTLLRIPYFWADDFEMEQPAPCWHLAPLLGAGEGLKVFNFHPIHVYLNSAHLETYQALKRLVPTLHEATQDQANASVHSGEGTQTVFIELAKHLAVNGESVCMRDIFTRWNREKGAD